MEPWRVALRVLFLVAASCGPAGDLDTVAHRPYTLHVPTSLDPTRAAPLVVMLHGFGSDAAEHEAWLRLTPLADREGFLYALPDGTPNWLGARYWNASDACCDFLGDHPDDVAYLDAVILDVMARHRVDPARVFVVGHSNGGFLAHRLACDLAPRVAAIVSFAGASWFDESRCQPTQPVAVLQIHGDRDDTIRYEGGAYPPMRSYPSARETVGAWAWRDGCVGGLTRPPPRDLVAEVPGAETTVERYAGCGGGAVELWTIHGGTHQPELTPDFAEQIWSFLVAHPRRTDVAWRAP